MRKCPKCKRKCPGELLSPLFVDGIASSPICAVCALEIGNKFHGIERDGFTGTIAQDMLEQTREHYKKTNQ